MKRNIMLNYYEENNIMRERVITLRIQLERNDKLGENEKKAQLERKTCFKGKRKKLFPN